MTAFAALTVPRAEFAMLTTPNYAWLGLSGVTTAVSWVFYYKAIKLGEVSTMALIDKRELHHGGDRGGAPAGGEDHGPRGAGQRADPGGVDGGFAAVKDEGQSTK